MVIEHRYELEQRGESLQMSLIEQMLSAERCSLIEQMK